MPTLPFAWNSFYEQLHVLTNRVTPDMFSFYKISLLLYEVINDNIPNDELSYC
jgi:hypothetical protein